MGLPDLATLIPNSQSKFTLSLKKIQQTFLEIMKIRVNNFGYNLDTKRFDSFSSVIIN